MLHVKRTGYIEQPNGDLVCSITIPAEHRARLLALDNAEPFAITLPLAPVQLREKTFVDRITQAGALNKSAAMPVRFISDLEDVEVRDFEFERVNATTDYGTIGIDAAPIEKPPAQTLNVEGTETSAVMAPENWQHPASSHFTKIYLHEPFQRFARERQGVTDPFAAPIPTAVALLRATAAGAQEAAKQNAQPAAECLRFAMTGLMDDYNHWCAANGAAPWPAR